MGFDHAEIEFAQPHGIREVWEDAARHYDEAALASLVLHIAQINYWNRVNAITKIAGQV